mgnify:CR=1 FL=1
MIYGESRRYLRGWYHGSDRATKRIYPDFFKELHCHNEDIYTLIIVVEAEQ